MARIVIAPPNSGGPELEVDQDRFDAGFFHGYVYVRDATPTASSEPSAEEVRMAAAVSGGTGPLPVALRAAYGAGSSLWLESVAAGFGFQFTSLTTVDAATGLPTAAAVVWPDGTTGTFTGTTDGSNGYTSYAVTWAGSTTKTVTASGITYDTTTGLALGPTSLAVA